MKKTLLIFQILIFVWMQIAPVQLHAQETLDAAIQRAAIPPMPKNYRLPDMHLLDTVAFLYKYQDKIGQRVDVEGFVGRFGATFGNDFKQKIYEIEKSYDEKIEIILTLTSTIEDAKVLKRNLESTGRKMVIVEIPDWLQEKIVEKATQDAQFKLNPVEWKSKMKLTKVNRNSIAAAASNAVKIVKNQYVKPNNRDLKIAAISTITAGVVTGVALVLAVGMDPMTIAALTTAKALFAGTTATFSRTIGNLVKTDITNELKIMTGIRKVVAETYYAIGTSSLTTVGDYGATQLVSDSMNSVANSSVASVKEKKLSEKARNEMYWYAFAFGAAMGLLGSLGVGSPLVIDYGVLKISGMQATSIIISGTLFLLYKNYANRVEKFAKTNKKELLKVNISKMIEPLKTKTRAPTFTMTLGTSQMSCASLFH